VSALKNARLMSDSLAEPASLAEEDARRLLTSLKSELENALDIMENERRESMDFYATWVHQIKTPISAMRMILEAEDSDEHRELLAELFRIEQYAEMVLTYLRLGGDTSDYVFKKYDIDDIIRQAVRKYAPLFIRRRIKLEYKSVHAEIITDEKWLLFIIEQLLSNSIKYTFEGSVTISFTQNEMLKISDTGIGIASEDLPRIFEKGFTGYNGRADKKSTGLGLYLCRTAADKLGHKIYAESVVGEGTTISIDLHKEQFVIE
jgi:signal transduction histidine kinase